MITKGPDVRGQNKKPQAETGLQVSASPSVPAREALGVDQTDDNGSPGVAVADPLQVLARPRKLGSKVLLFSTGKKCKTCAAF